MSDIDAAFEKTWADFGFKDTAIADKSAMKELCRQFYGCINDLEQQLSAITAERDALRIENERLCDTVSKLCIEIDALKSQLRFAEEDIDKLRVKTFARFHNEDCWIFQGDGEDHLESLTCPVVISPEELHALLALKARIEEAEPVAEVLDMKYERVRFLGTRPYGEKYLPVGTKLYADPPDTQELIRDAVEEERERFSKIDKAEFIGEFSFEISEVCDECVDTPDDDCPICQGTGDYQREVFVPWTTIKEIHKAMFNYAIRSRSTKEK